ncbi:MAG: hypothetical protein HC802_11580, partial [Caldilineaceae bacterium]|nr:hypothetical protein [Caldilineaceae bacterium]
MSPLANVELFSSAFFQSPQDSSENLKQPSPVAVTSEESVGATVANSPAVSAINILLLGTDARADDPGVPRTDTMILLTLD